MKQISVAIAPGWTVIDDRGLRGRGYVHVMPADIRGHERKVDCWCRPRLIRDNLFAEPIVSHRAPEVSGSDDRSDA